MLVWVNCVKGSLEKFILFSGLSFLFLVTNGNLERQSAALFLLPGMCSTVMFLPYNSKDHLSNFT